MTEIVVGIDGSESSQRALEWAAEEARLRGAHLKIVHAWFDWFVATGYFSAPAMYETSAIEESGRAMLEKAAASIPAGSPELDVEAALVHGRPESVLLNASQEADMVVVGSRGRGGIAGLLLGSVSQRVVHLATCPVVVIR